MLRAMEERRPRGDQADGGCKREFGKQSRYLDLSRKAQRGSFTGARTVRTLCNGSPSPGSGPPQRIARRIERPQFPVQPGASEGPVILVIPRRAGTPRWSCTAGAFRF